jgi:head-tail adaptor
MILVAPRLPVSTGPLHLCESVLGFDFRRAFKELHAETGGNVEGNVAVHEPCARVVGLESKDQVASGGEISRVATDGIVRLQGRNISVPDRILYLRENVEVVAVKVNGMG